MLLVRLFVNIRVEAFSLGTLAHFLVQVAQELRILGFVIELAMRSGLDLKEILVKERIVSIIAVQLVAGGPVFIERYGLDKIFRP